MAAATSATVSRAEVTARTWRSAPAATSSTARAISPTARPVSSEPLASWREAADTAVAVSDTWPIIVASAAREAL